MGQVTLPLEILGGNVLAVSSGPWLEGISLQRPPEFTSLSVYMSHLPLSPFPLGRLIPFMFPLGDPGSPPPHQDS